MTEVLLWAHLIISFLAFILFAILIIKKKAVVVTWKQLWWCFIPIANIVVLALDVLNLCDEVLDYNNYED